MSRRRPLARALAAATLAVSTLQAVLFALQRPPGPGALLALGLALAGLIAALACLGGRSRTVAWLPALLGGQLLLFAAQLADAGSPLPFRLLQVALLATYVATAGACLLAATRLVPVAPAFLAGFSLGFGLFLAEAVLGLLALRAAEPAAPEPPLWTFRGQAHEDLGYHYVPDSVSRIYYPDDPRGYFQAEDAPWRLYVHEGSAARLEETADPDGVRVAIARAGAGDSWHIQLNRTGLPLQRGVRYEVGFRARADAPRRIQVAMTRDHEPWETLGLYESVALTPAWQAFRLEFVARADDEHARLYFELGGQKTSAELAEVTVRDLSNDRRLTAALPQRHFVSYRTNALGCRGPDYAIPPAAGTFRILLLGDSYTLGAGVHEPDTFASRLESLLRARGRRSNGRTGYEVVNCGVGGYATRQERLFYELFAARYQPALVLLVMVHNDDLAWLEEVERGYVERRPDRLENLLLTWHRIQQLRHERPAPDYAGAVRELVQLRDEVEQRGSRFAVVIFRDVPRARDDSAVGRRWSRLVESVRRGLAGSDVPVLDLRDALYADHTERDLKVHALVDPHPNEVAHAIAAREILSFLETEGLLEARQ